MKAIIVLFFSLFTVSVFAADAVYYHLNPNVLQKVIQKCPTQQPEGLSCRQLTKIALQVNKLAYELRLDPQGFGQKILSLQEALVNQQEAVQQKPNQSELQVTLHHSQRELRERLAIVKWLESPEA